MDRIRQLKPLVAALGALAAAGCSGVHFGTTHDEDEPAKSTTNYGQIAPLKAIGGSAIFGKIRVIDRGDGASVLLSMMNVPPGDYRIAFTERPNCSSPNGFSAGAPWAPAGKDAYTLMPVLSANARNNDVALTLHVAGVRASGPDGVAGRSVVVFYGRNVTDAKPGVPNSRIACGVFETAHGLQF